MSWKNLEVAPKIGLTFGALVLLSILVGAIAVRSVSMNFMTIEDDDLAGHF